MYKTTSKNLPSGGILTINIPIPTKKTHLAVIFFHGFASDKNEIANIFTGISTNLLEKDFITIQVSFPGFGETKIALEEITFNSLLNTAEETYKELTKFSFIDSTKIAICGFSLGCSIAAMTYEKSQIPVRKIAFISPTLNLFQDFSFVLGQEVLKQTLHKSPEDKIVVEFWSKGEKVSSKMKVLFFKEIQRYSVIENIKKYSAEILLICGKEDFSYGNVKIYEQALINAKAVKIITIDGADHIFNAFDTYSTLDNVKLETSEWLELPYF